MVLGHRSPAFVKGNKSLPMSVTASPKLKAIRFYRPGNKIVEYGVALVYCQARRDIETEFESEFLEFTYVLFFA